MLKLNFVLISHPCDISYFRPWFELPYSKYVGMYINTYIPVHCSNRHGRMDPGSVTPHGTTMFSPVIGWEQVTSPGHFTRVVCGSDARNDSILREKRRRAAIETAKCVDWTLTLNKENVLTELNDLLRICLGIIVHILHAKFVRNLLVHIFLDVNYSFNSQSECSCLNLCGAYARATTKDLVLKTARTPENIPIALCIDLELRFASNGSKPAHPEGNRFDSSSADAMWHKPHKTNIVTVSWSFTLLVLCRPVPCVPSCSSARWLLSAESQSVRTWPPLPSPVEPPTASAAIDRRPSQLMRGGGGTLNCCRTGGWGGAREGQRQGAESSSPAGDGASGPQRASQTALDHAVRATIEHSYAASRGASYRPAEPLR